MPKVRFGFTLGNADTKKPQNLILKESCYEKGHKMYVLGICALIYQLTASAAENEKPARLDLLHCPIWAGFHKKMKNR